MSAELPSSESPRRETFSGLVGRSESMQQVFCVIEKAARSPYNVLIQGESGTGKELVARAIHTLSRRKRGPFVAVNCGAVPDPLLASELFGHTAGAFTGATQNRRGVFELAKGGTLFLDEVGTMSLDMQESLLRSLHEGEIRPVGSSQVIRTDVRTIAASNIDVTCLVKRTLFRADLYFRLNVLRVDLPPLRDRREDIPLLAEVLLKGVQEELGTSHRLDSSVLSLFCAYPWPGNVRELQNALRRASTMADGELLTSEHFRFLLSGTGLLSGSILNVDEYIQNVIENYGGILELKTIADHLGISRKTLWEKRKRWLRSNGTEERRAL